MDHMDDKMKRSYNGFRNAEMILDSLINQGELTNKNRIRKRIDNFRYFLIILKTYHK